MIEFYIDKFSYKSNEKIYFYINNSSTNSSINITILDLKKNIISQSSCSAGKQNTPQLSFAEGCDWQADYILSLSQIDFDIKLPNIYFVKIENSENEKFFTTFIIKRNIYTKAVVCNTNTWCAYNGYGGASFYFPNSSNPKHRNLLLSKNKYTEKNKNNKTGTISCNFKRPFPSISSQINDLLNTGIESERTHLLDGETFLWKFLSDNNYDYDMIIDSDVEDIANLKNRKIIFLNCHPEYWSHKMFFNLNETIKNKTNLIYLGGNGIWRKVILKNDRIEKIGYPYCSKPGILNASSNVLSRDKFAKNNKLTIEPYQILGMFYDNRGHSFPYCYFECLSNHKIFNRVGIKKGEHFGIQNSGCAPSGHESDKIKHKYINKLTKDNIVRPLLAKGLNKNGDGGEITIFDIYNSKVFSCGSIPFTRCLVEPKVKNMLINVINDFN